MLAYVSARSNEIDVLLTATISALVVSEASFRAANENPVKTLKTE